MDRNSSLATFLGIVLVAVILIGLIGLHPASPGWMKAASEVVIGFAKLAVGGLAWGLRELFLLLAGWLTVPAGWVGVP